MKQFLAMILGNIGMSLAEISSSVCAFLFLDEPEMPKSMIER